MNRTKLPIRKRLENVLQSSGSVDAAVAEVAAEGNIPVAEVCSPIRRNLGITMSFLQSLKIRSGVVILYFDGGDFIFDGGDFLEVAGIGGGRKWWLLVIGGGGGWYGAADYPFTNERI
ncbi:hypothetical protein AgCh_034792 [Apium graveolens]